MQKQTELRVMYRKRMERTQDYLRYCLHVAQENGILDRIAHSKGELQQSPISLYNASPQILTPVHHHPHLEAIVDQAKINGWYIHPTEVSMYSLCYRIYISKNESTKVDISGPNINFR